MPQMAQRALAQELLCSGGGARCSYHLALARLQLMSGEFSSAEASLQEALRDKIEVPINNIIVFLHLLSSCGNTLCWQVPAADIPDLPKF